jgi:hypothetical protein
MDKPGFRSTELWMTGLFSALAGAYGLDNANPTVQAAAVLAIGFMGGMYALSRGKAKGGAQ